MELYFSEAAESEKLVPEIYAKSLGCRIRGFVSDSVSDLRTVQDAKIEKHKVCSLPRLLRIMDGAIQFLKAVAGGSLGEV